MASNLPRKTIEMGCNTPHLRSVVVIVAGIFSTILTFAMAAAEQPTNLSNELRKRVEALSRVEGRSIGSNQIAAFAFLPKFYAALDYQLAWSHDGNFQALQEAVTRSWEDGLVPSDFHSESLTHSDSATEPRSTDAIEQDIVRSDALMRLLYQLYFGKVSPNGLDPNWNFARPVFPEDPVAVITSALKQGQVRELIERARLKHPLYLALKASLQSYTNLEVAGGWPQIPAGPALKPGTADRRVALLRARLTLTGEYQGGKDAALDQFDEKLAEALRRFQEAHGLDPDGALGAQTIAALNVTVHDRIDQIRVNLERARWILPSIGPDLVVVNIAGFYLRVVLDSKPVWSTRVIVGKTYHKTPIFTEMMNSIVLNPDWTVPRSIIRSETFPKLAANPGYLEANNYDLKDGTGATVNVSSIDVDQWTAQTFPLSVVQRPGPNNALGVVKFLFPNKYSVYLHDTPRRDLFAKSGRTFSHGCIRVSDPLKLAEIILGNQLGWDRGKIDSFVTTGKMHRLKLPKPLPVLLLYWTVDPDFNGSARFYDDIYGRDARLLKGLNAKFVPARN